MTHKRIICRKAFLEGKTTDAIARETDHSPEAFAIQQPQSLVQEYVKLLVGFGLNNQRLVDRIQIQLERCKMNSENERREQSPAKV